MPPAATRHPQQQQHPAAAHPEIRGVDVLKAIMDDATTPLRCLTTCVCTPSTCSSSDCRKRVEINSGLRVARACLLPSSIVETSMNSRLCIIPPLAPMPNYICITLPPLRPRLHLLSRATLLLQHIASRLEPTSIKTTLSRSFKQQQQYQKHPEAATAVTAAASKGIV